MENEEENEIRAIVRDEIKKFLEDLKLRWLKGD